jgi:transposase InsO family protein
MICNFKDIGVASLCSWFGITRQAYYQNKKRVFKTLLEEELIVQKVVEVRKLHPRMGGRKLFKKLADFRSQHAIKIGRDAFFTVLSTNNLLVKKRKRFHKTTNSNHWMRMYPNLIRELVPMAPNRLWVSDITYWKIKSGHLYISFITDAYSRKIVGYQVAETMEAIESIAALEMAIKSLKTNEINLVHHSDRGSQYCSSGYVRLLNKKGIEISMTENGDPLENALAERINGIIKGEYLFDYQVKNLKEAKETVKSVVKLYNEDRPHSSISYLTPEELHVNPRDKEIRRLWKNYYKRKEELQPMV